jgi:glutathione S-transferase
MRLDWQSVIVDIHAGEQLRPEYLRLNANGVVPTLEHDARVIVESTVINEYLQDAFAGSVALRPADPSARASMRLWTKYLDEGLHQACGILTGAANAAQRAVTIRKSGLSTPEYLARIPDPGRRARLRTVLEHGVEAPEVLAAVNHYRATLAKLAATLERQPWLAGGGYSLADAGFTPYLERLDRLGMAELYECHPAVCEWLQRVRARPSYAMAIAAFDTPERLTILRDGGSVAWTKLKPKLAR